MKLTCQFGRFLAWKFRPVPTDCQLSLLQPIYKGHNKDQTDPTSYRGIYLNDTLAKLFEGLLISRLTTHTELLNTPTYNQLRTNPDTQTHDAICSLFAIQYNKYTLKNPTYVAFIDYSTAYPSPLFIVMASPLPYSRMTFEATSSTISELGLIKLSSEFSTLASPHATQSTSSQDYPKGVVSA